MGIDFIDYTYLQKRGLLKKEEIPTVAGAKVNSQGFIELSEGISSASPASSETGALPAPSQNSGGFFGFLDTPTQNADSIYGSSTSSSAQSSDLGMDASSMKVKLDDLEYKLERLSEKMEQIASRLLEFERNTRI